MLGESEKCGSCAQLLARLGRLFQVCREAVISKCVPTSWWDAKPLSAVCRVCVAAATFRMQQGCSESVFFLYVGEL